MYPTIHLQGITKSFSSPAGWLRSARGSHTTKTLQVLRDVTLQVRAGEVMGVIGPNGAGKTTLLEIVATLQLPTSGSATIGGLDLVTHAEGVKRLVGYCPSDSESFYPRLTGRANLEFFAALDGLSPREARSRVEAVLGTIRAAELADARFQQCSAGMKQKLGLARALLADPPILLLDEPTRSLDPGSQRQFHVLLRHTLADRSGKTILIVTHSLREAERVCDRVALLRDGEIAVVAPARQVCGDLRFELPFHGAQPAPLAAEA